MRHTCRQATHANLDAQLLEARGRAEDEAPHDGLSRPSSAHTHPQPHSLLNVGLAM